MVLTLDVVGIHHWLRMCFHNSPIANAKWLNRDVELGDKWRWGQCDPLIGMYLSMGLREDEKKMILSGHNFVSVWHSIQSLQLDLSLFRHFYSMIFSCTQSLLKLTWKLSQHVLHHTLVQSISGQTSSLLFLPFSKYLIAFSIIYLEHSKGVNAQWQVH